MSKRQATDREIRTYLGHGLGNRRVQITRRLGHVRYYGSTDPSDRSQDYWHDGRWIEEYVVIDGEIDGEVVKL